MQVLHCRGINPLQWSDYSLVADGVKFRERDFSGTREGIMEYDRIGREATYFSYHSVVAMFGTAVVLLISAAVGFVELTGGDTDSYAWLFWLSIAALFFVYYLGSRRSGYLLSSSFGTLALRGKKSEVESFIAALVGRKLLYIEDRLSKRLKVLDISEVERDLLVLCEGGVLTDEEYGSIRANLGLEVSQGPRMGFMT